MIPDPTQKVKIPVSHHGFRAMPPPSAPLILEGEESRTPAVEVKEEILEMREMKVANKTDGATYSSYYWVVDSQFARIRKLNGFARIRPGYARLLDIVRIALLLTASPAARIRNSH